MTIALAPAGERPRRKWRRLLLVAVFAVLLLLALVAIALYGTMRASLPRTRGNLVITNLEHSVAVRFDERQCPYVQAETLADALSAQGWLHASHRLWQMELLRRAGRGRLAELLGESMLATDKELYRIGVPQLARNLRRNTSPEFQGRIDAYVAGVNAGIRQLAARPPEFLLLFASIEPWTADDVFAIGALMAYQSANNLSNELLRLTLSQTLDKDRFEAFLRDSSNRPEYPFVLRPPAMPRDAPTPVADPAPPLEPCTLTAELFDRLALLDPSRNPLMPRLAFGSNGWVVAPTRSATGHALFAFDSHDELGLPNLFYEVHLFFGGGKQIRGWSVPGLPGVVNGFNHRIAWGFTNTGDTQDLFLETPNPRDPNQFRAGNDWYTARAETVQIRVAGRRAPVPFTIRYTQNGPLISDSPPIALRWTAHEIGDRGLDAFFELNLAEDWTQFNAALDRMAAPSLNATYADTDGNIGFRTGGILPVRGTGAGLYPLCGDDLANRWQGIVPADQMPRAFNPPAGYLAAANARVNAAGDGPLVSADNAPPYRIARIQMVLSSSDRFTLAEMQKLQTDWYDGQAAELLPSLLDSMDAHDLSPLAATALDLLRAWRNDPNAAAESAAALVFQAWYLELAREVFEKPLGKELFQRLRTRSYVLNNALDAILRDDEFVWWQDKKPPRLAAALNRVVANLDERLGPDINAWRLDRIQHLALAHDLGKAEPWLAAIFNLKPRPLGGGPATVGRANYRYDRPFHVSQGPTVRVVADMKPAVDARSVMPAGQSGHPLSAHYSDQLSRWLNGLYFSIPASPTAVGGDTLNLTHD